MSETEALEAARLYLKKTVQRPRWEQFLHALVATNEMISGAEVDMLKALKRETPNPEQARLKCPIDPRTVPDAYNKLIVSEGVCRGAYMWPQIRQALEECRPPEWFHKNVYGLRLKGGDMARLLAGCNTVVVDRHLIRMVKPKATDSEIRKIQSSRRLYNEVKQELMRRAERERLPYSLWHVKEWLKRAEAPKTVGYKKYVEELFG